MAEFRRAGRARVVLVLRCRLAGRRQDDPLRIVEFTDQPDLDVFRLRTDDGLHARIALRLGGISGRFAVPARDCNEGVGGPDLPMQSRAALGIPRPSISASVTADSARAITAFLETGSDSRCRNSTICPRGIVFGPAHRPGLRISTLFEKTRMRVTRSASS